MNRLVKGAATGLSFAGIASILTRFKGFNSETLIVLLYMYVLLGIIGSVNSSIARKHGGLKKLFHNIVIVVEGEEMKMKKLLTGEKYRIDGDIEKI